MSQDKPTYDPVEGADNFSIAIVAASYNPELVEALQERTRDTLIEKGVKKLNIDVRRVPGSNELPYLVHMLALTGEYDCIIALGVVIAGDTSHHEVIERTTAAAFQSIGNYTEIPIINGVITTLNREQAEARCVGEVNRGEEFANAALIMAEHKQDLVERLNKIDIHDRAQQTRKPYNN